MANRILVVDDDRKIVRLIQSYLEQAGMIVLTAYDGDEAMQLIRRERPDLIVLDIMLPGQDGWSIARWLRADAYLAKTPILMLTARVEDTDKIYGFELGTDDYLTKPFNPEEMVARVKAILRRAHSEPQPSRVLQIGTVKLDIDQHTLAVNDQSLPVTPTEFALLRTLMEYPNHTFTRGELIERALGYTYDGLERTLDSHIKNLRKKIEPDPAKPNCIETVYGVGYRFREGDG
ncbi:MAG: response regulator transcription factor [Anaerolineae bacterium]|nr:response regulator transcription factor [Anaerolineae bacterium]